jgi:hypothetical protein
MQLQERLGLAGKGLDLTDPVHSRKDICLLIGGGRGVWEDYTRAIDEANKAQRSWSTFAVNAIGMYVPDQLDYWFSLHCDRLVAWEHCRLLGCAGRYRKPKLISFRETGEFCKEGQIDATVRFGDPTVKRSAKHGGSLEDSGFFAMCIALCMGFKSVWLVGCPADDSGHVFIPDWK